MRLSAFYRRVAYAVIAVLVATGGIWVAADQLKESDASEFWQWLSATALMVHGGTAMIMLMLLGALIPLHVQRSWRAGSNRVTGIAMFAGNIVLVLTAFGLYYFGSPFLRSWTSAVHLVLGFSLPIVFVVHIVIGRRYRTQSERLLDQALAHDDLRLRSCPEPIGEVSTFSD